MKTNKEASVEEIVEKLQKCPICSGKGTIDCDECEPDTHECSRCIGGKIYEIEIDKVTEALQTQEARLREEKEKSDVATFGNIYTNGINYWMVIGGTIGNEILRPVVLTKEGKVSHFVGYYNGTVNSIKPRAIYHGNIHTLTPHH